jgi:beta-galactosidase
MSPILAFTNLLNNLMKLFFKKTIFFTCMFLYGISAQAQEKLSFNKGWKFYEGDIPFPVIKGHGQSYMNAKAGSASGAAAPGYDDHSWRTLNLPHDWAIENPNDSTENVSQGYRKRGFGWYRRKFKLDSLDRGKHLELQFEGIATYATIWINGSVVHRNWCGYTSSYIDITPFAKYGDEVNTIAVRVDANSMEGWWYEGAGIYRDTWLIKRSPVHIITDGVYANPVKLASGQWEIPAEISLQNTAAKPVTAQVEVGLYTPAGKLIEKKEQSVTINTLDTNSVLLKIQTGNPALWTIENPALYQVKTIVKLNGNIIDSLNTKCGFRTLKFDADSGFYLNGKHVKLKGVCNHLDHAGLGVAVPDAIQEFRLRKLKEMGVNAYRCSHNPPSASFLDLCDRMGILVMDENRNFNSSPEYVRQLQWLVRRDRNHPSIILWSVFNEEPMQGTEIGYQMVRRMSHEVKKLDSTRPVTAAMNGGLFDPVNVSQAVDVVGFNYQIWAYDRFHKENPTIPLTSSEDVSAFMTRGEYTTNNSKHVFDGYDTHAADWGATHRNGWKAIAERPYLAGGFVWTGFDYHGEPTPHTWPTVSSFFGIMDLCGFPKTAYYIHQAQWLEDKAVMHLVPDWNWPADSIGKDIKVMAISNAETVKLFLNGKLIGEQNADKYEMNTWQVPFQPGKLMAIGYAGGKEVSRYTVETTGNPVSLALSPDRISVKGNGIDALPVTVEVLDAKGRAVPHANFKVNFTLNGPGRIVSVGNGDPNSHEPEKGNIRSLFNGLAQVIIQTDETSTDQTITLTASAEGMKPAKLVIPVKQAPALFYVPVISSNQFLDKWLVSEMSMSKPDPKKEIAENDMNSWQPSTTGKLQKMTGKYVMYRSNIKLSKRQIERGSEILFKQLTGKAEIWVNGEKIGEKTNAEPSDFKVDLPKGKAYSQITVLFQSNINEKTGLGGVVEFR